MFYERANGLIAAVAILALLAVLVLSTSAPAICDGCDGQVFDYISQGEHTSYRCKSDCGCARLSGMPSSRDVAR